MFCGSEGVLDRVVLANVAAGVGGRASLPVNLFARFFQWFLAAAYQKKPRAQFCKLHGHGAAEPSASAGQKNCTSFQKVLLEHGAPPFRQDCTNARESSSRKKPTSGKSPVFLPRSNVSKKAKAEWEAGPTPPSS